mmetsp:Transcript_29884/g.77127  ORF Transcript_29884/g.77127 Transcript_29884/m.77127 type:complete len:250 (-) Transcript_29884:391-1140(-)
MAPPKVPAKSSMLERELEEKQRRLLELKEAMHEEKVKRTQIQKRKSGNFWRSGSGTAMRTAGDKVAQTAKQRSAKLREEQIQREKEKEDMLLMAMKQQESEEVHHARMESSSRTSHHDQHSMEWRGEIPHGHHEEVQSEAPPPKRAMKESIGVGPDPETPQEGKSEAGAGDGEIEEESVTSRPVSVANFSFATQTEGEPRPPAHPIVMPLGLERPSTASRSRPTTAGSVRDGKVSYYDKLLAQKSARGE